MKLMKAMVTVGGLTGLSRIAGFVRDILTAAILGAGPVADAFFVALKLPNFFRRVTAEGAFSVSFVPLYAETAEKEGEGAASLFAGNAFSWMFIGLSAFTVLAVLGMPWIIYVIAPGFSGDAVRYDLAVELSRVTFPYLLLMSLTALLGGVLNAHDRFAPFAAAPILFNLSLIGFLLLSAIGFKTPGHALAWGVLVAGFLQFGLLAWSVKRAGLGIRPQRPRSSPRIRKLLRLMGPGVIGAGVMHVNLFADLILASLLETGSISYLYYADRLNQLPLGIIGIAIGTTLLPMLSRALARGKWQEAHSLFNRAMEVCLLLALPAAVGLFMIPLPIVVTLFQHGAFDFQAAAMTAAVLSFYALGLPAYMVVKVYSASYWARQDTLTPVKISIATTFFNIGLSLWFIFYLKFGAAGIAAATAVAGWMQAGLLARGLRGHEETRFDARFKRACGRIVLSCALMGTGLYFLKEFLKPLYLNGDISLALQVVALVVLIGAGLFLYGGAILALGVVKAGDIVRVLRAK